MRERAQGLEQGAVRTRVSLAALVATATAVAVVAIGAAGADAGADAASDPPVLPLPRPADFVATIDHPYLPFAPGSRWVYRSREDGAVQRTVVRVLDRTRTIAGIEATVVRDTVRSGGAVVEDTWDWYAQDTAGNVWYLGEATKEYADGTVSTAGSWEAGRAGASAGIAMPADPVIGRTYRQEMLVGEAEDLAKVVDQDTMVRVPAGLYRHAWLTEETTPLQPRVSELKLYAKGVGVVMEDSISPSSGRTVLVRFEHR